MPSYNDFPAIGRILSVNDDSVVFQPQNSTYELKLLTNGRYGGPAGQRIECAIRATARKLLTVPSGGSFIAPIFGPPRIIQGRIRYLDEKVMVVQAGVPVVVELPSAESAYDMTNGHLAPGILVNVAALPGPRLELLAEPAAR